MDNNEKQTETKNLEQDLINSLAREVISEQRLNRRWGIFFKLLLAVYLFAFLVIFISDNRHTNGFSSEKHTALIDIQGVISADSEARADHIVTGLRNAFEDSNTQAVILRINSPGGSPVQAGYVNDEIRRLRAKYPDIPLYAVIDDLCASGGYYIAVAADKIYANKASIVGSIGVVMAGFGFVDAIDKLGVERRLLHAGENKGFMDPFQPIKTDEKNHVQSLLNEIHQQFISVVKNGRGDRLAEDDRLFSGLIWSGEQAVELGLVDDLASSGEVARDIVGTENIVNFTKRENVLDRFARNIGASLYSNFLHKFELF